MAKEILTEDLMLITFYLLISNMTAGSVGLMIKKHSPLALDFHVVYAVRIPMAMCISLLRISALEASRVSEGRYSKNADSSPRLVSQSIRNSALCPEAVFKK